ncbi:outer membrane beta-barrel protein [Hufsiella ginkgonis]|uniref:Outer membrane beta-barrel protein n=1 Tax=Hufsiella ginkgonis TaxID=2695274 RepID=A0A7K1XWA9_9SPHI|nr:outer membrane beta-barrel protein [Hufsiella ginkgonis]MXV14796.1 outer membrane beta-barrel protein [Hufsiella ginkgonis]
MMLMYHRDFLAFVCTIVLLSTTARAQESGSKNERLSIQTHAFYKQEDLRWSIAGNLQGQNPNIYSELAWKKVSGPGIGTSVAFGIWGRIMLTASYDRSTVSSGKVNDTDYQQDNRTMPSYQATLETKGNTSYLAAGAGYRFFTGKKIRLSGFAGFEDTRQSLIILSNEITTGDADLNSTYRTSWAGPYAGLKIETGRPSTARLQLDINYCQASFSAKADWKRIDAFAHPVSFKHEAKGYVLKSKVIASKAVNKTLSVFAEAMAFYSVTAAGTDELFLADGGSLYTRLNEVKGKGGWIGLGVRVGF